MQCALFTGPLVWLKNLFLHIPGLSFPWSGTLIDFALPFLCSPELSISSYHVLNFGLYFRPLEEAL